MKKESRMNPKFLALTKRMKLSFNKRRKTMRGAGFRCRLDIKER